MILKCQKFCLNSMLLAVPRQDSNLRSRLRSAFLPNAVTSHNTLVLIVLGRAWGAETDRGLLCGAQQMLYSPKHAGQGDPGGDP